MLRISIQDEPNLVTMKLEGSLAGTWVIELEESWRAVKPKIAGRHLCVHLAEVERVDTAGRYLLVFLGHRGFDLSAEGVVMVEFVRPIAEDGPDTPAQSARGKNASKPKAT